MVEIALAPNGRCKMCDNLITKPEACFLPDKLGTQWVDAPFCKKRNLHYDYIRRIDEGDRDCGYFIREGIS